MKKKMYVDAEDFKLLSDNKCEYVEFDIATHNHKLDNIDVPKEKQIYITDKDPHENVRNTIKNWKEVDTFSLAIYNQSLATAALKDIENWDKGDK